jgi:hypothetical protein
MSISFGRSKSQQSSQLDPQFKEAFFNNYSGAQNLAGQLPGMRTQDFYAGNDYLRNSVNSGYGLNSMDQSASALGAGANYATPTINRGSIRDANEERIRAAMMNRGDVRDVNGGSFLNMNVGDYMNPYLQQVAGNVTNDMNRARQMQMNQLGDQAMASKAFGGSRHGVAEAETNRGFFDRLGSTLDNIYAGGFNAATGLAGQDLTRGLQAGMSNQQMDFGTGQLNTQNRQQANVQNAANNLQAQFANQQMDFGTQQANQQAALQAQSLRNQAGMNLANVGQMQQQGAMNYGNTLQSMGMQDVLMALQQRGLLNEALGLNPGGGSGMQSQGNSSSFNFGFSKPV